MKKRILSLLLTLVLLLALLPTGAAAEEEPHLFVRAMTWNNTSQKYVENTSGRADTNISMPIGGSNGFIFYYGTEGSNEKIAASDLVVAGKVSVETMRNDRLSDESLAGFAVDVSPTAVGEGSVSYTPHNGTASTVTVNGMIPDVGFYGGNEIGENAAGFINEFNVTNEAKSFYLLLNGWTFDDINQIQGDGLDFVTIEAVGERKDAVKCTVRDDVNLGNGIFINIEIANAVQTDVNNTRTLYANIRLTDGREALMVKNGWMDDGVYHENDGIQTALSNAPDISNFVNFYYGTSANPGTALSPASVTFTPDDGTAADAVTLEKKTGYWQIDYKSFGSGTLKVKVDESTVYTLPVAVTVPSQGFFTSPTDLTEETYVADGSVYASDSGVCNDIYLVVTNQWQYIDGTNVSVNGPSKDLVTASLVKTGIVDENGGADRYAIKLSIAENAVGDIDFNVGYSVTTKNGEAWENDTNGRSLRLVDTRSKPAGLYFAQADWGQNGPEIPQNPVYGSAISQPMGSGYPIALYYYDGTDYTMVTDNTKVGVTGALTLAPSEEAAGLFDLGITGFDGGTLTYQHDEATQYNLPVSVTVPSQGFFTSYTNLNKDTYVADGDAYTPGGDIYFVMNDQWQYIDGTTPSTNSEFVTASLVQTGTVEKNGDATRYAIKLHIADDAVGDVDCMVTYGVTYMNNDDWISNTNNRCVNLIDIRPTPAGLYWAEPDWGGFAPELPENPVYKNAQVLSIGSDCPIALYYYDGDQGTPVTSGAVVSGPFQMMPFDGTPGCYELSATGVGSGTISYEAGGNTYTVSLTAILPNVAFFTAQSYSADKLVTDYRYSSDGANTLWLMSENGFTKEQTDSIRWLTQNEAALPAGYVETENVERGSSGVYDVKVTILNYYGGAVGLKASIANETPWPDIAFVGVGIPGGEAHPVTVDGNEYVVGFGYYDESGVNDNCTVDTGEAVFGPGGDVMNDETTTWKTFTELRLLAASEVNGVGGYGPSYLVNRTLTAEIQVNRVWIEPLTGDSDAMALSPTGAQELRENIPQVITIYAKPGSYGYARVCASITVNGETLEVKALGCFEKVAIKNYTRPEEDTVAALNSFLADIAADINAAPTEGQRTYFRIDLNGNNYSGTIDFPDNWPAFSNGVSVEIIGNGATVTGGMDLTGVNLACVDGVNFVAETPGQGRALYNGGSNSIIGCSFTGYDIACDSSSNAAALCVFMDCTFTNNNVGVVVDHGRVPASMGLGASTGNSFVGNGTAIRLVSTNMILTPFELRWANGNFIGNETDVDVDCNNSIFYFYANYFGSGTAAAPVYRAPVIDYTGCEGSIVYTNPRRSAPYTPGETAIPPLVLDDELPVSILNNEAASLLIAGDALTGVNIGVLGDSEELLGSWDFTNTED